MQCKMYEKEEVLVSQQKEQMILIAIFEYIFFDSKADKNTASKKRQTCRAGAGIEATYGHCDTDGFQERTDPEIV